MKCGPIPDIDNDLRPDNPLKDEYFMVSGTQKARYLLGMLSGSFGGSDEDRIALMNVCILELMVLPRELKVEINDKHLRMAADPQLFSSYPWGQVSYNALCASMRKLQTGCVGTKGFNIEGFLQPLVAWAFEVIPEFAAQTFTTRQPEHNIPRMLKWAFDCTPTYDELKVAVFENTKVFTIT